MVAAIGWLMLSIVPSRAEGPLQIPKLLQQAEQTRIDAIAHAMPTAVSVFVPGGGGGGSGVLISPEGYALTNFHVTSPAGTFMRCGLSDGKMYDAVIVGIDPVGDLAMIRLLGRDDFPAVELGNSLTAQPGDWSMVIGNPFLLASNLQPTVTWGILSGVGRYQYPSGTLLEYGDCLQTDASINPGNSGGPIYDSQGRLLGIVGRCSFEKRGRVNVGVGYAISVNQAKNFLGYLRSGRIVDHATLGATVATDPDGGVRVTNILTSSDAYRRGIRYAAEILEVDGRVVQTANDLQNVLATFPSGWRVPITFRYEGETKTTLVRLASVHAADELLAKMAGALPPPPPREEPQPDEDKKDGDGDADPHGDATPVESEPGQIPSAVQDLLIERQGYANYYFNQQIQLRFIEALRAADPTGTPATDQQSEAEETAWIIKGQTDTETPEPVLLRVTSGKMAMLVGDRPMEIETDGERYEAVTQNSIAGMLTALDAWRRMIAAGPQQFGETFALGSMPLGGQRPLRDVMVGIDGDLETRWLTHPETRAVEAIEVFADRDEDPAELWLIDSQEGDDASGPILDLRYGTESVLRVRVDDWQSVPVSKLPEGIAAGGEA